MVVRVAWIVAGACVLACAGCADKAERRRAEEELRQIDRALADGPLEGRPLHGYFARKAEARPNAVVFLKWLPAAYPRATRDIGAEDEAWHRWAGTVPEPDYDPDELERWLGRTEGLATLASEAAKVGYTAVAPLGRAPEDLERASADAGARNALRNRVRTLARLGRTTQAFAELETLLALELDYHPWSILDWLLHRHRVERTWAIAANVAAEGLWSASQLQVLRDYSETPSTLIEACWSELIWQRAVDTDPQDPLDLDTADIETVRAAWQDRKQLLEDCHDLEADRPVDWQYADANRESLAKVAVSRTALELAELRHGGPIGDVSRAAVTAIAKRWNVEIDRDPSQAIRISAGSSDYDVLLRLESPR